MNQTTVLGQTPYRLNIPADLAHVAKAREWLGEVGRSIGLPDGRVFDLQVAASEAVANGIEHASSEVEIVAWALPDRLLVEITNDGVFSPGIYKDKEGRRRGLGLPLMVSLADHVHVSRLPGDRTKVSLTFFTDERAFDTRGSQKAGGAASSPGSGSPAVSVGGFSPRVLLLFAPLPLLVVLVGVLYGLGVGGVSESASLLSALNALFVVGPAVVVAYLAARTYLAGGSRVQLLLGSGAMLLALAWLLAGPLITHPNQAIAVHNTLFLVAGVLFSVAGAILARGEVVDEGLRSWRSLVLAYGLTVGLVAVWASLAGSGSLPAFVVPETGYTVLRNVVLGLGVIVFIIACALFLVIYRERRSLFALLTALSFAMFAVSLGSLLLTGALSGSPIVWVGRAGQWIGGLYLLAGALSVDYGGVWLLPLERSLRETQNRYDALVDANPDAVWIRADGRFVFANAAAARLFGYSSPADLLGRKVDEILHPATRDYQRERVAEVLAGGISPALEEMFVRSDGSTVHATVFRARVEYAGRPGVQTVAHDITERRQAEDELRAGLRGYEALLARSPLGFARSKTVLDAEGVPTDCEFIEANDAYLGITGLTDVVGRRLTKLVPNVSREFVDLCNEVALTGVSRQTEIYEPSLDRRYHVTLYSPEAGQLVSLLSDISGRNVGVSSAPGAG